ncbi:Oxidoreductase claN [Pseudocercospora fuligena]|uniref:Oxidoreductase claN n=1 Tax=Pseudocercospora fuligena TaxID=685502 RepID=A0A8H6R7Z8_9PEZI|nr:Oxidoreductase claN [Pseudocercospora fuligena]
MQQKIFLVTGSSSGLGLCLCRVIIASGHKVVATMRQPSRYPDIVSELESTGSAKCIQLDVSAPDLEEQLDPCVKIYGHVDVLINNAGYGYGGPLEDIKVPESRQLMDTLFWGPIRTSKVLIPYMRSRGSGVIVNVGSAVDVAGMPGLTLYGACKAAIADATEALHGELAPLGIRMILAEMGDMRTSLLDSGKNMTVERPSAAYANTTTGFVMQAIQGMHGKQDVDPAMCAKRIVEEVLGGSEDRSKFVRLPLGKQYVDAVRAKGKVLEENLQKFEEIALSCDFSH